MKKNQCYFCKELKYKKDTLHCSACKATSCNKHMYQWVDESNCSITNSQPELCLLCYTARYPKEGGIFQERQIREYNLLNNYIKKL